MDLPAARGRRKGSTFFRDRRRLNMESQIRLCPATDLCENFHPMAAMGVFQRSEGCSTEADFLDCGTSDGRSVHADTVANLCRTSSYRKCRPRNAVDSCSTPARFVEQGRNRSAGATRLLRAAAHRATLLGTPGRQHFVARRKPARNARVALARSPPCADYDSRSFLRMASCSCRSRATAFSCSLTMESQTSL